MPKIVKVNRAQVHAARLIVSRAARGIGQASPAVHAIANAKPARSEQGDLRKALARLSEAEEAAERLDMTDLLDSASDSRAITLSALGMLAAAALLLNALRRGEEQVLQPVGSAA